MVIISTSAVDVRSHAVSPLLILSAVTSCGDVGAAGAAAGAATAAGAAAAGAVASGAAAAGVASGVAALSCAKPGSTTHSAAAIASIANSCFIEALPSKRVRAGLAGADAHDLQQVEYEHLAVTDLAGVGGFFDRFDHAVDEIVADRRLDLYLRQEVDDVFRAAIELGMTFLAAEALDLGDGDSLDADRRQCLADLVELERLDDGSDKFHGGPPMYVPNARQNVFCTKPTTCVSEISLPKRFV